MPLVTRKRGLLSCIADVVFAPIAFVGAGLITTWPFLLLAAACAVFCFSVSAQTLELDWPSREFIIIAVGTLVFIALAAVPLVIRDYILSAGLEYVWIPDEKCVMVGRQFAEFLLSHNFQGAFALMHPEAKANMDIKQFSRSFLQCWEQSAAPDAIENVSEMPIDFESTDYLDDDAQVTAMTTVTFSVSEFVPAASSCSHRHHLSLYLRPLNDSFRIMSFAYFIG